MQTVKNLMFFIAGGAVFSLLLAVQIHNHDANTVEIPPIAFTKIGGR